MVLIFPWGQTGATTRRPCSSFFPELDPINFPCNLSRFEINPVIGGRSGANPGARLTLGKRISKELSVTYSTNVTSDPNQILAIEYRVSDRLSFVAQYEQASTQQLSSRNNSFSFEIRFRKRF